MSKVRIGLTLLSLVLVIWLFYEVRVVFVPFIYGFLLAYFLDPLVDWLEKYKIPRGWAIILVYLLCGLIISGLIFFALPVLIRDLSLIIEEIPRYTSIVQQTIQELQLGYQKVPLPEGIRQVIDQMIRDGETLALNLVQGLALGIVALFSQTFNLVLAPILSFYFLLEFDRMGQICLAVVPVRHRAELTQVGTEISQVIKKFIRGNLLVALLVGVLSVIGMSLIGIDYALLIGIIVSITNFIPYFGAIISIIPVILVALVKSKWLALYALGLMLIIQQIEGNIIAPKILGESVGLHPLIVIFALLVAGELFGIVGLLIAVPVTAILKILLKHILGHVV